MKKITIIGGSGFVGTNLCDHLKNKNIDFEIIDLKISKRFAKYCKIADVRDLGNLRKAITGNIVINLAAIHRDDVKDKEDYYKTNVVGAKNIISVCKERSIKKIIFTSSVAVYGFAKPETDENGAINPFNEYGKTKYAAEKIFRKWQINERTSLIIIRPTVIFGEGNRGNVYNLFNQIYKNRFFMIGSGSNKKSIAYVKNVAAFLETCVSLNEKYVVFNYVDTPNYTINELVELIYNKLKNRKRVRLRIPYILGLIFGIGCDFVSKFKRKKLSISSIRVKKFVSSSDFVSNNINLINFSRPFTIKEGVDKTLESEFINIDPNKEIFYTE